jgi:hypothetical protein
MMQEEPCLFIGSEKLKLFFKDISEVGIQLIVKLIGWIFIYSLE